MVSWIKLWEYANQIGEQFYYTITEDETLFRDYMKYMYYYNGVIGIDDKNSTKYYYKTKYTDGTLTIDVANQITYNDGGLDSSNNISQYPNGGELWLID